MSKLQNEITVGYTDEEIAKKRQTRANEQAGTCTWCEKSLSEIEDDEEPVIVYAAFGSYQDRFVFCSVKCEEAFKKQYPVRIHKNCYNRSCLDCDLCVKKQDGEDETILKRLDGVGG